MVGAQGIRRRKKYRALPEAEDLPPGDAARLFGRFTWGAFTPAGNLERNGFFWRQLRRARPGQIRRAFDDAAWSTTLVYGSIGVIVVSAIVVWKLLS